jgi:hypothetical protein
MNGIMVLTAYIGPKFIKMKKLLLSAIAVTAALTSLQAQFYVIEETGPVSGYAWDGTGTTIMASPNNDVYSSIQTLPFSWTYYGQTVTQYIASDNGYITFETGATTSYSANTAIPSTAGPNNAIYAAWDDLNLIGAGTPDVIKSWTYGTMPNRTHVIQWHSVNQNAVTNSYLYAAILIHESGDFDIVIPWAQGTSGSFTIGCEDATGADGIEIDGSPNYALPSSGSDPVDDLVFHFLSGTQPAVDPKLSSAIIPGFASPSGSRNITGKVQNLGANTLSSFDITWTDGSITKTYTVNNSLASGASYEFEHPDQVTVAAGATSNIEVSVVAANDANSANNTISGDVDGFVFVPHKVVVGEEATGTWCGWCPRGMVGMEYMEETYEDDWIGIAVHNNDPMENATYDAWMGGKTSGYPSGLVDRKADIDPSSASLEAAFNVDINEFGVANIEVLPLIDENDEVEIRVRFHFATDWSDDVRVAVIIAEDGLTGTSNDWRQTNYYSYQSQNLPLEGAGFNWQAEPSYVTGVTYNDVGRELLTDVDGDNDIIEAPFSENQVLNITLDKFTWNSDYDMDNSTIIVMLIDDSSDEIINAGESHLKDLEIVEQNGVTYYIIDGDTFQLWDGTDLVPTGMANVKPVDLNVKVYPNPSNGLINVELSEAAEVVLLDMAGRVVARSNIFGTTNIVQFNGQILDAGVYNVVIKTESVTQTERVTIIK